MPPSNERRPGEEAPHDASSLLLPQHQKLIDDSAILPEVAVERGYRSVRTKAELKRLGFGDTQCNVPALLIPVRNVHRDLAIYQARPDQPRIGKNGKPIKYETPGGSRMVIDVPLRARALVGDPSILLFITEGIRKADAGVSAGLCTIGLLGVWNWRGTNDEGGKAALADWDSIALNGREIYLVFDSDVMQKRQVHQALARLKAYLESRHARVLVIYLSPESDGSKVGLDDYFAAGGTAEGLLKLASPDLKPLPAESGGRRVVGNYYEEDGQTFLLKATRDGEISVPLGNFTARIVADTTLDDGVEQRREFQIQAALGSRVVSFSLPSSAFAGMNWPTDRIGARACVSAGLGQRDHLRAAIQNLSEGVVEETIFTHAGWRLLHGHEHVYLHAGGAIGPNGPVAGIQVRLGDSARHMVLPAPPQGDELRSCIRACLMILDLAPPRISFVLLAATFRAAMGDTDFSILLFGPTGSFKTEYAAILQGHYGLGFDARHLPGSWLSTANMLEMQAFTMKDALFVIDDFVPGGSRQDMQRLMRDLERLLRAQGNCAGRGRLSSDATPKEGHPPRGTIFVTCEDLPTRHSALARTVVLEVGAGDSATLTKCQNERDRGTYAKAMSGFLMWASARYPEIKKSLGDRARQYRDRAQAVDRHRRTASIIGELQAGMETFLDMGVACGAFNAEEQADLRGRSWSALCETAEAQSGHHVAAEPAAHFLELLASAISSGRAHIAGMDGNEPANAEGLGWRAAAGGPGFGRMPQGVRVGWVEGDDLYLEITTAYKAAQEMASDTEKIPVLTKTLCKRLQEAGHLRSTDQARKRLTVRRQIENNRSYVLHMGLDVVTGVTQSAQADHRTEPDAGDGESGPDLWADVRESVRETGPADRPTDPAEELSIDASGPDGPVGPVPGAAPAAVPSAGQAERVAEDERWGAA